jgi:hypothetical protein
MKKQVARPFRMAPLQRLTVRPLEDPAEQAALDELLKRREAAASSTAIPESGSRGPEVNARGKKGTGTN